MKIKDYCPAEFHARLATDDEAAAAAWMCCRALARNMPMGTVTSTGKTNLSCSSSLYLNTVHVYENQIRTRFDPVLFLFRRF
jgi:hypothetical protein